MRGITVFVVLLIAVTAYAQGPSTRTKKGPPPARRGDNTDRGLPSGKDVPDGRRRPMPPAAAAAPPPPAYVPRVAAAAPPPRAAAAPPAVAAAAPPPPGVGAPPPARPMGRPGDNTDIGLPSGADVPDGRRMPVTRTRSGPPPAVRPAAVAPPPAVVPPSAGAPPPPMFPPAGAPPPPMAPPVGAGAPPPPPMGRPGDNTDRGLPSGADVPDGRRMPVTRTRSGPPPARRVPPVYRVPAPVPAAPAMQPPMFNPWVPAAPAAPVAPVMSCEAQCPYFWQPVCSVHGNTYDNDCRLSCSGEQYACEGQCPCEEPPMAPAAPVADPFWGYMDTSCNCPMTYDPVCTESGDDKDNECLARCDGHKVNCSGQCPCS